MPKLNCAIRCCTRKNTGDESDALIGDRKRCCTKMSRGKLCCLIASLVVVAAGATTAIVIATRNSGDSPINPTPPPHCEPGTVLQLTGGSTDVVSANVTLFQSLATGTVGALHSAASAISLAWNGAATAPFSAARAGLLSSDCTFTDATGTNVLLTVNPDLASSEQVLAAYQSQRFHLRGANKSVKLLKQETRKRLIDAHMRAGMTQPEAERTTKQALKAATESVENGIASGHNDVFLEVTINGQTATSGGHPASVFCERLSDCIQAIQEATVEAVCRAASCPSHATGSLPFQLTYTDPQNQQTDLRASAEVSIDAATLS